MVESDGSVESAEGGGKGCKIWGYATGAVVELMSKPSAGETGD